MLKKLLSPVPLFLFALTQSVSADVVSKKSLKKSFYSESLLQSTYTSWGIDPDYRRGSINLKESWKMFKKSTDIVVAVVDTGIEVNHPFLRDNIYVKEGKKSQINYGIDFSQGKKSYQPKDTHGHGTHVAGIIKSVFPDVKILPIKYYNPQASGQKNLEATIKALKYAVDQNVDIINYSGGGPEASSEELTILKKAREKGILVIAAAGNEKSNIDIDENAYYPASYGLSNIISVSAHNEYNKIIASSNWGSKSVDIAAPGYKIRSTIPGGKSSYMTGTSQATAFVTGVVAMIKSQYPRFNYDQLKNVLISSSMKVPSLTGKVLAGGKLNAARALDTARQVYQRTYGANVNRSVAKR